MRHVNRKEIHLTVYEIYFIIPYQGDEREIIGISLCATLMRRRACLAPAAGNTALCVNTQLAVYQVVRIIIVYK